MIFKRFAAVSAAFITLAQAAQAQTTALNSGDTAWVLAATCLVIMMTVPGLALFYGGLVRKKNVLSTLMQSFAACCLVSILWIIVGYSFSFSGQGAFLGDANQIFLRALTKDSLTGTIPESLFMVFQMSFAIITPAVICGAFADRMKFSSLLWFFTGWLMLVYVPVAHWVWGGGFLAKMGFLDFAGGTVVEINSGVAGLVAAIMLGKRRGFPQEAMVPHNLILSVTGAGLLWVGWLGFNGGSALAANATAAFALANTQIAGAAAALVWMGLEWYLHQRPSVLGIISGAVAGLVAITPACAYVSPMGAMVIGAAAGGICLYFATSVKRRFGYDDSLDVFGVHGIGGIVGVLGIGVLGAQSWGGTSGLIEGNAHQLLVQFEGVIVVALWCGVWTFAILKVIDMTIGLRVTRDIEVEGLDLNLHGEVVP
ncbi:MAG: ammonium transporter [Alphaproteobacteria bacterium]|nr:ammonium transporter [Alphaproteobacteria bacterium]